MKIAILKERRPHETRVAATPETVKKLKALGAEEIVIETGAGVAAAYTDEAYAEAGAMIVPDAASAAAAADVIFKIQRPMAAADGIDELALLRQGQVLMSPLGALTNKDLVQALAAKGVTSFALELIPRITRAQSMDILSSQANLAGYKAVLVAANEFGRIFPQMMTPAGTLAPARAFIMGVGVAGLQAIATARRLGAIVTATDVRPATKEQVQSLGAKFVAVEDEEFKAAETAGGYAKEMSADYQRQAGRAGGRAHQEAGHRHHHRADPRPQGAGAGERGHGQDHEARLGDRRHGGRAGRQLPAVGIRQGGREARREDRRPGQPAGRARDRLPPRCSRATC